MKRDRAELEAKFSRSLFPLARVWSRGSDKILIPFGLSSAVAWPLVLIGRSDGIRQVAIAEQLGIESASLVRLLDQLCASELVVRGQDETDRRANTLQLTEKGADLARQIEEALVAFRHSALKDLSDADLRTCLDAFRAVEAALADE
jgi:MarR family transcriptional regulator for hemolysin